MIPTLLTFKPLGSFFFGGSESFNESFHVISRRWPSMMTLLGMLRFTILAQLCPHLLKISGERIYPKCKNDKDQSLVQHLTGDIKHFKLSDTNPDLGIIKKISPVFLVKLNLDGTINDCLFPLPADVIKNSQRDLPLMKYRTYSNNPDARAIIRQKEITHAVRSLQSPKLTAPPYLGGSAFWKNYCLGEPLPIVEEHAFDELFRSRLIPGIRRSNRNVTEQGFFMKQEYRLKSGFAFGILVRFRDKHDTLPPLGIAPGKPPLSDGDVQMGGERSRFQMRVLEPDKQQEPYFSHPVIRRLLNEKSVNILSVKTKYVGLGPVTVSLPVEKLEHCWIPAAQSLRQLQYNSKTKKTDSYRMIPRGAVVIPGEDITLDDPQTLADRLGGNCWLQARKGD